MPSASGRCDGPRFARDYLPIVVVFAAIFVASSIPGQQLPQLGAWGADKVAHAVEFALLGFLLARAASRAAWGDRRWVVVAVATVIASAWGGLDEIHQLVTPNRMCDWRDWIADTAGGVLGAVAQQAVMRFRAARRPPGHQGGTTEAAP